jgi:hypothetical protein
MSIRSRPATLARLPSVPGGTPHYHAQLARKPDKADVRGASLRVRMYKMIAARTTGCQPNDCKVRLSLKSLRLFRTGSDRMFWGNTRKSPCRTRGTWDRY